MTKLRHNNIIETIKNEKSVGNAGADMEKKYFS